MFLSSPVHSRQPFILVLWSSSLLLLAPVPFVPYDSCLCVGRCFTVMLSVLLPTIPCAQAIPPHCSVFPRSGSLVSFVPSSQLSFPEQLWASNYGLLLTEANVLALLSKRATSLMSEPFAELCSSGRKEVITALTLLCRF